MKLDLKSLSPQHQADIARVAKRSANHQRPRQAKVECVAGGVEYDSGMEARYATYLETLARTGGRLEGQWLVDWDYHPLRFSLAPGLTYTPDFGVIVDDGEGTRHYRLLEVKGSWKAKNARESRVRLVVAAHRFPFFEWRAVTEDRDGWQYEDIGK